MPNPMFLTTPTEDTYFDRHSGQEFDKTLSGGLEFDKRHPGFEFDKTLAAGLEFDRHLGFEIDKTFSGGLEFDRHRWQEFDSHIAVRVGIDKTPRDGI